jgi:transposase-like protein
MIFPVEGGDQEVLSCGGVSIWVLHAMRDALNKVQKKDRDALTEALKKIYRAET